MQIVNTSSSMMEIVDQARCAGTSIGLVPTMGALHAGHLHLADAARRENALTVMSVFVNPTQFGPGEDFDRYPRDLDHDRSAAEAAGIDVLFVPRVTDIYPDGPDEQRVWVEPGALAAHLCGASRPDHFRGVLTVVAKLFHLVKPHTAYFGQKDGQQALLITRMARDLAFGVEIRVLPTVREADGLALSSRNVYLDPAQRAQAPILFHALQRVRSALLAGERDTRQLEALMQSEVRSAPLARLDYATIADSRTLQPVEGQIRRDAMAALAIYFGSTRLIDNLMIRISADEITFS